jgi:hypothetical protein
MENIFEKGCLVQLSVSQWGAARKIDKGKLTEMVSSPDWVRATKKLVDPESLKPISKMANEARSYLTGVSLPFPIKGLVFIPKDLISRVDERLQDFKERFESEVNGFLAEYSYLRNLARIHLGELFNELDYPVNVRQKFAFSWRFVILDVPNGNTGLISPEIYEREKEKFVRTMEEARELAVQSLRVEFAGMVERITDRFSNGPDGKPKVFKNSTVKNFYQFFETFKEWNIFRDAELAELVERAKEILGGETAEDIRSNDHVKERIRSDMEQVESAMAEVLVRPRRKIVMG